LSNEQAYDAPMQHARIALAARREEGTRFVDASTGSPAHDPVYMREILQRHLGQSGATPLQVSACRIANTRRRDGSRGTVEYELRLEDASSGRAWEQRVTGITFGVDRTQRVWQSLQQSAPAVATRRTGEGLPAFGYIPELDLLLQVFPHDYRLPALAELMAGPPPDMVPKLLAELGDGDWQLQTWTAEPVQYRVDMRAILRVTIQATERAGATAERQFYAKIYRDADAAQRAFQAQSAVSCRAAERHGAVSAARPIAIRDEMRTLVTEALPGLSLSRIIRRGHRLVPALRIAARAVAEFHELAVAAPPRPVADEVARLREAETFLVTERPDLAADVSSTVQTIADRLDSAPTMLIHGDLKPDHIIIDGDRVALIDFDLIAAADPVADVAHLIAFLTRPQERARSRNENQVDAAEIFVDEYFAHAPPSWRERLPVYHAMTSIHKAVGLCRRRGTDGQTRLEDILREGQAILDERGHTAVPTFKRRMTRVARER
jgi:hypothetical protein